VTDQESSSSDEARLRAKARNRAWVMHHPLASLVILVGFAAGDVWLRLWSTGQHSSAEEFGSLSSSWFLSSGRLPAFVFVCTTVRMVCSSTDR
jgi:hypothetical protein